MVTMGDVINIILDMATVDIGIMDNKAAIKMDIMGDIHNIILVMVNNINLDMAAVNIGIMDMVNNIILDMAIVNIDIMNMVNNIIMDIGHGRHRH